MERIRRERIKNAEKILRNALAFFHEFWIDSKYFVLIQVESLVYRPIFNFNYLRTHKKIVVTNDFRKTYINS